MFGTFPIHFCRVLSNFPTKRAKKGKTKKTDRGKFKMEATSAPIVFQQFLGSILMAGAVYDIEQENYNNLWRV